MTGALATHNTPLGDPQAHALAREGGRAIHGQPHRPFRFGAKRPLVVQHRPEPADEQRVCRGAKALCRHVVGGNDGDDARSHQHTHMLGRASGGGVAVAHFVNGHHTPARLWGFIRGCGAVLHAVAKVLLPENGGVWGEG